MHWLKWVSDGAQRMWLEDHRSEEKMSIPILNPPNPHARIKTPRCDSSTIESYSVNLAKMPTQGPETLSCRHTPDLGGGVVASAYDEVAVDLDAANTRLMAGEDKFAGTGAKIPHAEGGIAGAGNGNGLAGHFEAADGRGVAAHAVDRVAVS